MLISQIVLWAGIILARPLYGAWLNPTSLYSVWWSLVLGLYGWRLIEYDPTSPLTVWVLLMASLGFVVGSLLIPLIYSIPRAQGYRRRHKHVAPVAPYVESKAVLFLSALAAPAIALGVWEAFSIYGTSFVGNLNSLYVRRLSGESLVGIPYVGALSLSAVSLVGNALGQGRWRNVYVVPLVLVFLDSVVGAGRAKLVMSVLLVLFGLFSGGSLSLRQLLRNRHTRIVVRGGLLAFVVLLVGIGYITSTRGVIERYGYESPVLTRMVRVFPLASHLYHYMAGSPAVLNAYLRNPSPEEPDAWGANTFAPVYNVLDKLGVTDANLPDYKPMYSTPVRSNPGSYVKDLLVDFGMWGVVLVPFLLGFTAGGVWWRAVRLRKRFDILVLPWVLLIVFWSFSSMATGLGYVMIGLVGSAVVGLTSSRARRAANRGAAMSTESVKEGEYKGRRADRVPHMGRSSHAGSGMPGGRGH